MHPIADLELRLADLVERLKVAEEEALFDAELWSQERRVRCELMELRQEQFDALSLEDKEVCLIDLILNQKQWKFVANRGRYFIAERNSDMCSIAVICKDTGTVWFIDQNNSDSMFA